MMASSSSHPYLAWGVSRLLLLGHAQLPELASFCMGLHVQHRPVVRKLLGVHGHRRGMCRVKGVLIVTDSVERGVAVRSLAAHMF
jgi:hypothetical protein